MRAGKLRHRVTIESPSESQSDSGEVTSTWAAIATVWAAVEPLSGRERLAAEQAGAEVAVRVRMRYVAGVTPTCRILHGTRYLEIAAVIDPAERGAELELLCREAV